MRTYSSSLLKYFRGDSGFERRVNTFTHSVARSAVGSAAEVDNSTEFLRVYRPLNCLKWMSAINRHFPKFKEGNQNNESQNTKTKKGGGVLS